MMIQPWRGHGAWDEAQAPDHPGPDASGDPSTSR